MTTRTRTESPALRALRERQFPLATRMREIVTVAEEADRGLTGDEETERRTLIEQYDAIEARVTAQQELEERSATLHIERNGRLLPGGDGAREGEDGDEAAAYRDTFRRYLRYGVGELNPDERMLLRTGMRALGQAEQRALGTTTGAAGGFTVPTGFLNRLVETRALYGGMRQTADVITTETGNDLPFPTVDDTANVGAILGENTQITQQDVAFGQKTLRAYVYTSKLVLVPLQLLTDTAIDVEGRLAAMFARRLGRAENAHFTTGTGAGQPEGFVNVVSTGKTGATGQTVTAIVTDLIDLEHSVDPAYRIGARYMMRDASLAVLKKILDGNGRPIWNPSVQAGEPSLLNGYPYTINQNMAAMAANAKSIAFGDFSQYVIRDVQGIQVVRLEERYADYLQVGFFAFSRTDGMLADTSAIKVYANSAT